MVLPLTLLSNDRVHRHHRNLQQSRLLRNRDDECGVFHSDDGYAARLRLHCLRITIVWHKDESIGKYNAISSTGVRFRRMRLCDCFSYSLIMRLHCHACMEAPISRFLNVMALLCVLDTSRWWCVVESGVRVQRRWQAECRIAGLSSKAWKDMKHSIIILPISSSRLLFYQGQDQEQIQYCWLLVYIMLDIKQRTIKRQ